MSILVRATRFAQLPVFIGVGTAFALQVVIAVSGVVAVLFAVGAVLLWRTATSGPEDGGEAAAQREETPFLRAAAISFGVLFAAEWGDLSQLATAGLAARHDEPVSVFVGAWSTLSAEQPSRGKRPIPCQVPGTGRRPSGCGDSGRVAAAEQDEDGRRL